MVVALFPRYFNPTLVVTMPGLVVTFANGRGLQIAFRIDRSMLGTPDSCDVAIANLEPTNAKLANTAFATLGISTLSIAGGYDGITAGMFVGDVRSFRSAHRVGVDVWTECKADDGGDAYSETLLRISTYQMTAAEMIAIAATAMGLVQGPSVAPVLATSDYTRVGPFSFVMVGKAHELLDAACRRIGARWWIRDKQLHLARLGQPDRTRPAVLIGPESITGEVAIGGSGEIEIPCMFDPNIVPGGQVAYRPAAVSPPTLARVERVVHTGQTRGALWSSQVTGRLL